MLIKKIKSVFITLFGVVTFGISGPASGATNFESTSENNFVDRASKARCAWNDLDDVEKSDIIRSHIGCDKMNAADVISWTDRSPSWVDWGDFEQWVDWGDY